MNRLRPTAVGLVVALTGALLTVTATASADATDWVRIAPPAAIRPEAQFYGVSALSSTQAWAVGTEYAGYSNGEVPGVPLVVRQKNTKWSKVALPGIGWKGQLRRVVALSATDVWSAGTDSSSVAHLVHYDGTSWSEASFPGQGTAGFGIYTMVGSASAGLWMLGQAWTNGPLFLLHHTSAGWQQIALPAAPVNTSTISLAPDGTLWLAGWVDTSPDGYIPIYPSLRLEKYVDGGWHQTQTPDPSPLVFPNDLLMKSDGTAWIGGAYAKTTPGGPIGLPPIAAIVHWDGTAWHESALASLTGGTASVTGDSDGNPEWAIGTVQVGSSSVTRGYLKYVDGNWVRMASAPDVGSETGAPEISSVTPVPGTQASIAVGEVALSNHQSGPRMEREDTP
jgi:hypothetical protein